MFRPFLNDNRPADTCRLNNVASTSVQRHDVAPKLMRRCLNVPLGYFLLYFSRYNTGVRWTNLYVFRCTCFITSRILTKRLLKKHNVCIVNATNVNMNLEALVNYTYVASGWKCPAKMSTIFKLTNTFGK